MTEIIVAFGCQIRDGINHADLVAFLNKAATPKSGATSVWTYPPKSPVHTISIVYTKADFAAALDRKDAVVVYDGHSRIGQGPAFGPANLPECPDKATYPLNPWDDSFRMGFDCISIECFGDIIEHGTSPSEFDATKAPKTLFVGDDVKAILANVKKAGTKCGDRGGWRSFPVCAPKAAAAANCSKQTPLAARHFWREHNSKKEYDTLVSVGDADLAKSTLACSILFMNSCSSKEHYLPALSRRKKAAKSNCVFFMTAQVCSGATTKPFIEAVLKGKTPQNDSKEILKRLNRERGSGFISLET